MTQTEVLKMALEALERNVQHKYPLEQNKAIQLGQEAITAIKEALAVDKESLTTEARHMPSNDALYKAWNLIGADLAGLKFEDFVRHLLAQQSNEQEINPKTTFDEVERGLQQSRMVIATLDSITTEQRQQINEPLLKAQLFLKAISKAVTKTAIQQSNEQVEEKK